MDSKPKRRWYRFSLRTLLVLATVACVGFGWLGMKVRAKQKEREAVKAIQESGNGVKYDYERYGTGTFVNGVRINPPIPPGPEWLRKLVGDDCFADVVVVWIPMRETVESDVRHLRDLPYLQELWLDHSQIDDAGLVHLARLSNLKELYLLSTRVTDAGLVHLQGLSQLEWLKLNDTQITDAGLVHLHGLTKLKLLDVGQTAVTDAAVDELLKALPNLNVIR